MTLILILSLDLDIIDLRRQLSDILFIYNLLNGFIDSPHLLALLGIKVHTFPEQMICCHSLLS